jgi:WD40 repeat protein
MEDAMIPGSNWIAAGLVFSASACVSAVGAEPGLPPRALVRLGTDDLRVQDAATDLAFSPDGKIVAASSELNSRTPHISLFDAKTGRLVRVIRPADKALRRADHLAFSPDGAKLLWGAGGGQVVLWDLENDRTLLREKVHANAVGAVAFSPDGSLIASAGGDGVIQLRRSVDPRRELTRFKIEARGPVRREVNVLVPAVPLPLGPMSLAFTPDGSRLIVGSGSDWSMSIWRIEDGRLLSRIEAARQDRPEPAAIPLPAESSTLNVVAAMPDGRRVLSLGQRTVERPVTMPKYLPSFLPMTEAYLWDIETGERVRTICGGDRSGFGQGALSHDGRRLAVVTPDVLRILNIETGKTDHEVPIPISNYAACHPAFSPDDSLVALAIGNAIALFDVRTGRRILQDEAKPEGFIPSASWSPKGDRIATGHSDGRVRVWDVATGKLLWHKLPAPAVVPGGWIGGPSSVIFSGDGRRIVAAGMRYDPIENHRGFVTVYEATRGLLVRAPVFQAGFLRGALSPDRSVIVTAGSPTNRGDGFRVYGIDAETGLALYATPPGDGGGAFQETAALGFQPDSASFLMAVNDGNVVRFDARTGREEKRFLADWRTLDQIKAGRPRNPDLWIGAFSQDGRTLATSSSDAVYVWDVETGKLRQTIRHANQGICRVGLSPDGRTLATADVPLTDQSSVDTIHLYDSATGEQIMTLEPSDNRASTLAFSPDGSKLFTGFLRGSAMIWDVRRGPK